MTNELKAEAEARISKAEAQMAICNRNTAEGINFYNHFKAVASEARRELDKYTDKLPKKKIKLHVAEEATCDGCQ